MSYGKLNIWLRYLNCALVTDCWRADLVIKTCGGEYLVDMLPGVIDQLKTRYPDFQEITVLPNYHGETRISIKPPKGKFFNHVEVDVPPGCYLVWLRACQVRNEETNKIMAIVDSSADIGVNLLLNTVEVCGKEFLHPFLVRAVEKGFPIQDIRVAANMIMDVVEKPKKEMVVDLKQRMEEAKNISSERLIKTITTIQDVINKKD
jgi:hypothetical protein